MRSVRARFDQMPWSELSPHAREKRCSAGSQVLRLLELSPGFQEPDWCRSAHFGYVVAGTFRLQFSGQIMEFSVGDGLAIHAGDEMKHRAIVDDHVQLFLVEPA